MTVGVEAATLALHRVPAREAARVFAAVAAIHSRSTWPAALSARATHRSDRSGLQIHVQPLCSGRDRP